MMIVLYFIIIAIMRVLQKICSKKASEYVNDGITFFHYGGYYQMLSAVCALVFLCFVGFYGFNLSTIICAVISALLFALDLFAGIEAIKGTSLVVCNMFALGGLFVPCVAGIFLFDEPMSIWQWSGLIVFVLSIYFLSAKENKEEKKAARPFTLRTFFMLVLSFIVNGLVMLVQKYFALLVPDRNEATFSFLTFAINAVILYAGMLLIGLKKKKSQSDREERIIQIKKLPKPLLVCGAVLAVALFTINLLVTVMASEIESVVLFTVSSALSIVITALVGALIFKEKLTAKNYIGLVLGFFSCVMVSVF